MSKVFKYKKQSDKQRHYKKYKPENIKYNNNFHPIIPPNNYPPLNRQRPQKRKRVNNDFTDYFSTNLTKRQKQHNNLRMTYKNLP